MDDFFLLLLHNLILICTTQFCPYCAVKSMHLGVQETKIFSPKVLQTNDGKTFCWQTYFWNVFLWPYWMHLVNMFYVIPSDRSKVPTYLYFLTDLYKCGSCRSTFVATCQWGIWVLSLTKMLALTSNPSSIPSTYFDPRAL